MPPKISPCLTASYKCPLASNYLLNVYPALVFITVCYVSFLCRYLSKYVCVFPLVGLSSFIGFVKFCLFPSQNIHSLSVRLFVNVYWSFNLLLCLYASLSEVFCHSVLLSLSLSVPFSFLPLLKIIAEEWASALLLLLILPSACKLTSIQVSSLFF